MTPTTTQPEKPRYRVKAGSRIVEQNSSATSSRQTDKAGTEPPPSVSATPVKRKPLRPHCLNPDLCAGSGREHCHSCKKALAKAEEPA